MFKERSLASLYCIGFCFAQLISTATYAQHGAAQSREPRRQDSQSGLPRIAPPEGIKCSRNNLTSYNGKILAFRRQPERTTIRVRTDWETTEQVVLRYAKNEAPIKWFLLNGEPFESDDWKLIESSRNRLRPGVRANIWVCDDGTNPIVDWRPPVNE